jgi:hypothetical protein
MEMASVSVSDLIYEVYNQPTPSWVPCSSVITSLFILFLQIFTLLRRIPRFSFTMKTILGSRLLCASMAHAANHVITLGNGGRLQFSPNQVTAAVNDTLEFIFAAGVCFNFPI